MASLPPSVGRQTDIPYAFFVKNKNTKRNNNNCYYSVSLPPSALIHLPPFVDRKTDIPHAFVAKKTTGDLPESSGDFPVRPEWEKEWTPKTGVCLQSAYKQVDGKEPDFTNNAKVYT